jgi:hypothetical protein
MPESANIQGTIHVDTYLTNYSQRFVQDGSAFVAQKATSVISVNFMSNQFAIYDRGYFLRDEAAPRPLGGRPEQVGYKVTPGVYSAVEYALEHVVDDRQRANVDDPIRLDENATAILTGKMMIKQDRHWAQNFFVPGKWTTQVQGVVSSPGAGQFLEFTDANSDPIGVIDQYCDIIGQSTGMRPNTLVLGANVRRTLRTHPDIADRIKYTQIGVADDALLARLFNLDTVVTARSIYNSAAEGAVDVFQYIADGDSMLLMYIDPNPGLDSPTAIATFAWTGLLPGLTNALGGVIERGRDERAHSDWFQDRMAWDMKIIAQDLGVFFNDVVGSLT